MSVLPLSELMQLGLSEREAQVYCSAMSLGAVSALRLSQETGIKRSTVYTVIDSLLNKGLMHIQTQGVKQYFVAENPEKLIQWLENQKNVLDDIMPILSAQFFQSKGSDSTIKYYPGRGGVLSVYSQLLKELKPGDTYSVISDREKWYNIDSDFFERFLEQRAKLDLNIRVILQQSAQGKKHAENQQRFNLAVKFLPTHKFLNTTLVIVPHKIILTQTIKPFESLVIENKSIVAMHQAIFDTLWETDDS